MLRYKKFSEILRESATKIALYRPLSQQDDYRTLMLAVFDYPKNLTLFDTECKKVLVPRYWLLVLTMVFGVQRSICHKVNTGVNSVVNYFNSPQE